MKYLIVPVSINKSCVSYEEESLIHLTNGVYDLPRFFI
jgi:hypothetical protein